MIVAFVLHLANSSWESELPEVESKFNHKLDMNLLKSA